MRINKRTADLTQISLLLYWSRLGVKKRLICRQAESGCLTAALRPGKLKKVSGPCLWGIWFRTDSSLIACLGYRKTRVKKMAKKKTKTSCLREGIISWFNLTDFTKEEVLNRFFRNFAHAVIPSYCTAVTSLGGWTVTHTSSKTYEKQPHRDEECANCSYLQTASLGLTEKKKRLSFPSFPFSWTRLTGNTGQTSNLLWKAGSWFNNQYQHSRRMWNFSDEWRQSLLHSTVNFFSSQSQGSWGQNTDQP